MSDAYLAAALEYAARGWHVFPLCPVADGACACGETDPKQIGKHPLRGFMWRDASTADPAGVARIWGASPGAGIGIDCGRSGVVVADIDVRTFDGIGTAKTLGLTSSYVDATPSGGLHLYYAADPDRPLTIDNTGKIGDGIDLRAVGGYVVAAPTSTTGPYVHLSGTVDGLAFPPEVIFEQMAARDDVDFEQVWDRPVRTDLPSGYVGGAIAGATHEYIHERSGAGDRACFALACRMLELANAPWAELDVDTAVSVVADAARERRAALGGQGGQTQSDLTRILRSARRHVGDRQAQPPPAVGPDLIGNLKARQAAGPVASAEPGTAVALDDAPDDDECTDWLAVDLGPYLDGSIVRPEPTLGVRRQDGLPLLYPGLEHSLAGETESGKSWFACLCVVDVVFRGGKVLYLHFEESDPAGTVERLVSLGMRASHLADQNRFRFVAPAAIGDMSSLTDWAPDLVIGDGINEAMSLFAREINDAGDTAAFRRTVIKPYVRAGAAWLSLDHVPKDRESRGRYSIGSVHKINAVTGASYQLELIEPFTRGGSGASALYVVKDRPGFLRSHGRASKTPGKTAMGTMTIDDTRAYVDYLDAKIFAPKDEDESTTVEPVEQLREAIITILNEQQYQLTGTRELYAALRAKGHKFRNADALAARDDVILAGHAEAYQGIRGGSGLRSPVVEYDEMKDSYVTGE